jgi:hypothetical protein
MMRQYTHQGALATEYVSLLRGPGTYCLDT